MFKKYQDVFCGAFLIVLAAILFILSFGIKSVALNLIKADFFPRLDAGLLFILGSILVITGLINAKRYVPEPSLGEKEQAEKADATKSMLETLGLIVAYLLCLKPIGFLISTFLYLVVQMYVLTPREKREKKNYILFVIISAVCSLGIYLIFVKLFHLMLPAGILQI